MVAFAAADLQLTSLRVEVQGSSLQVSLFITNQGPKDAANLGCNIYLYSNQKLLISQTFNLDPLAAGASRQDDLRIQAPSNGQVTKVTAEVFDAQEPDLQPSSNFAQVNIKPPETAVTDLRIISGSIENDQPVNNDRVLGVRVQLKNEGTGIVKASRLSAELRNGSLVLQQNEKGVGAINAGQELEMRIPLILPPVFEVSDALVTVRWTPDSGIQDTDGSNNTLQLPVLLVPRMPDLIIKNADVNSHGALNFSVRNDGTSGCGPTITAVYVNGALVRRFKTPALGAGQEKQHQYGGTPITSGSKILIVADFNADVTESSETNNRLEFTSK